MFNPAALQLLLLRTIMLRLSANLSIGNFPKYGSSPRSWVRIMVFSSICGQPTLSTGILLAAGTWIVRGTLFLKSGGIVENFGRCVVISC
jgi:hypothetical protein